MTNAQIIQLINDCKELDRIKENFYNYPDVLKTKDNYINMIGSKQDELRAKFMNYGFSYDDCGSLL
jgi:hypothetical protein